MSIMILCSKVHLVHHYVLIVALLYHRLGQISMSKIPSETQDQLNYESLQKVQNNVVFRSYNSTRYTFPLQICSKRTGK